MINLNELRELRAAAGNGQLEANHFCIAAHNAMPALIAELEIERKRAAALEKLANNLTVSCGQKNARIAELEAQLELASLALAKREPEPVTFTIGGTSEC